MHRRRHRRRVASTPRSPRSRPSSGPVEVVVANAGITRDTLLMRMTDDDFTVGRRHEPRRRVPRRQARVEGHAEGPVRPHHPGLERRRPLGARRPGQLRGVEGGLVGIARSLTRELGGRGITANVVAPGFIETDMTAELPEAQQAEYKKTIPAGRFAHRRRGRQGRSRGSPATTPPTSRARSSRSTAASAWGTDPSRASARADDLARSAAQARAAAAPARGRARR